MIFEKLLRIPTERIAVLIGKSGSIKSKIEKICHVNLDIDVITSYSIHYTKLYETKLSGIHNQKTPQTRKMRRS